MQTPAQQMRALGGPLMTSFADMIEKGEAELSARSRQEASRPDSWFDREPLPEPVGIVGLVRHAILRTGFSAKQLERMIDLKPGTLTTIVGGTQTNLAYMGGFRPRPLVDFVNVCRYLKAADPGVDLRSWWAEKRHNKRKSPLELIRRISDPIFDPYRAELSVRPQSQLGGHGPFVEAPLFYLGPGGLFVG